MTWFLLGLAIGLCLFALLAGTVTVDAGTAFVIVLLIVAGVVGTAVLVWLDA